MTWGSVWRVIEGRERFGWWFCWDSIPGVVVVLVSSMAGLGEVRVLERREVYVYIICT